MTAPATLGQRLRLALAHARMSQRELAERVGLSPKVLTDVASDRRPAHKHLPAMADALGVPLSWLLTGRDAPAWAETAARLADDIDEIVSVLRSAAPDPVVVREEAARKITVSLSRADLFDCLAVLFFCKHQSGNRTIAALASKSLDAIKHTEAGAFADEVAGFERMIQSGAMSFDPAGGQRES